MIRHIYSDGSEGYEYQVGDKVCLNEKYPHNPTPLSQKWARVTRVRGLHNHPSVPGDFYVNQIDLSMLPRKWPCPVGVLPWMLEPALETVLKAATVDVPG